MADGLVRGLVCWGWLGLGIWSPLVVAQDCDAQPVKLLAALSEHGKEKRPTQAWLEIRCAQGEAQIRYAAGSGVLVATVTRQGAQWQVTEPQGAVWTITRRTGYWDGSWRHAGVERSVQAMVAGSAPQPLPGRLAGRWTHQHQIEMLDGSKVRSVPARNSLVLKALPSGLVRVQVDALFANAHSCGYEAVGYWDGQRLVTMQASEAYFAERDQSVAMPCVVTVHPEKSGLTLDVTEAHGPACRAFCGARGYLDGLTFGK